MGGPVVTGLIATPALALTNERGGPVPSQAILSELHKIDPALGLRFIAKFENSEWAVTWEWRESDVRWSRVRSQEIPRESAYDIIGYLPVNCSVDQAKPYIDAHLKGYPKEEISRLRAKLAHWNEVEIPKQQVAELVTDTLDDVARDRRGPKGRRFFGKRFA